MEYIEGCPINEFAGQMPLEHLLGTLKQVGSRQPLSCTGGQLLTVI